MPTLRLSRAANIEGEDLGNTEEGEGERAGEEGEDGESEKADLEEQETRENEERHCDTHTNTGTRRNNSLV